jgi:hypothetical protein
MSERTRLLVAVCCFSAWMALLEFGLAGGRAVHLLLLLAALLFPWRGGRNDRVDELSEEDDDVAQPDQGESASGA